MCLKVKEGQYPPPPPREERPEAAAGSVVSPLFGLPPLPPSLPSDSASRPTPLLRRTVPLITARRGLSPPKHTTCVAHNDEAVPAPRPAPLLILLIIAGGPLKGWS